MEIEFRCVSTAQRHTNTQTDTTNQHTNGVHQGALRSHLAPPLSVADVILNFSRVRTCVPIFVRFRPRSGPLNCNQRGRRKKERIIILRRVRGPFAFIAYALARALIKNNPQKSKRALRLYRLRSCSGPNDNVIIFLCPPQAQQQQASKHPTASTTTYDV